MATPTFCIGVPTYKRADDLQRFIVAIKSQLLRKPNVRLVIVNDASHDDAYQRLVEQHDGLFEYRVMPQNAGPAMARQEAFSGAEEDFLVMTDDDCIPGPDWLDYLEAIIAADPDIDVIAGQVEPVWHSKPSVCATLMAARSNYPGPVVSDHGLLTAVGANAAFRRTLFEQIGGYERALNVAAEDCCLTQRAIRAGGRYLVAWNWLIGHKAETNLREIAKRAFNYGFGSVQYTLLEQDWVLAEMCSDGTFAGGLKTIRRKVKAQWAECRELGQSWVMTLGFTAISVLKSVQFERGWNAGLRKFSKAYECDLPQQPDMAKVAVNFSDERVQQHALGV
ncbi:MAG: glycosyltransferase [Alphaproteobacteria bacterium]